MESLARQNFVRECEAAINRQINMELEASYAYFAFANYFGQDTVAQPHAAKFFREQSHEEREHAEKLAHYQNLRGGRVAYQDVKKPSKTTFTSLQEAMETALQMEKSVNESLLQLHSLASSHNDPALADFIETEYLHEQVKSIKQFADYVTQLKRNGPDLGEYLFEKLSLKD
ncbi:ferritin heavy chain [Paragonimus westermani]|uniref:Ferritin n=2 Tax=Paragonimus westermani TaxID=34504 RepID=A0A5J4P4S9_9TREM|nr:ferritin heavy chain [Paragonimus westermani]